MADLDSNQRVCKQNFEAMDLVLGIECYKNNSLNHEMPTRFRDETI
jgi:hypothetical protein